MEVKIERKIDTTELKERLNKIINVNMKDRTYACISKDDIKDIVSILEYLENIENKQKKCFRDFDLTNFACHICENRDVCKEKEDKK